MKLIRYKEPWLFLGTKFHFKGSYPFEEKVTFMLVDYPNNEKD